MKGFSPPELTQFYRLLHGRGLDTKKLAAALGRTHVTVSRVLCGSRRRGPIWKRLKNLLTREEILLLDVVQASTWNKNRVRKRPRWNLKKLRPGERIVMLPNGEPRIDIAELIRVIEPEKPLLE